ncbi:hypothetical protein ACH4TY_19300 [Streptomyces anulatus]
MIRMNFSVTQDQLVQAYGLDNVQYFPQNATAGFSSRSATFLSLVGLPHSEVVHLPGKSRRPLPSRARWDHSRQPLRPHDSDVEPEELSARFRETVGAFDSTPFADDQSQWNRSLEELEHGIW